MKNYYLILDVETIGLPNNWDAPVQDTENWPQILEIGWALYENSQSNFITEESFLIKQTREIPKDVRNLTGISTEETKKNGTDINYALTRLVDLLQKFKPILVGHNIEFDTKIIQASLIRNEKNFELIIYDRVCTMKTSKEYCDLPGLKYPKLDELYLKIYGKGRENVHRVQSDVEDTSKVFFKLLDMGIIKISELDSKNSVDIKNLSSQQINNAIKSYLSDLSTYPLFYNVNDVKRLKNSDITETIKNKFNNFYQTDVSKTFEIPYNQISNRNVLVLSIEDIVLRYVLKNYLKLRTNFIRSSKKYDHISIEKIINKSINECGSVLVKIDIYNCFEEISHEKLISVLVNQLDLKENSNFVTVFKKALEVIYKNNSGEIKKKKEGVLIGSIPDQYFAELLLDKIEQDIRNSGTQILRIGDEFTYFCPDIKRARDAYKKIERTINKYDLSINKSKTVINDLRSEKKRDNYELSMVSETIPGSSDMPGSINLKKYTVKNKGVESSNDIKNAKENYSIFNIDPEEIPINSYESSKIFLDRLSLSKEKIINYQKNFPDLKYFWTLTSSHPTETISKFKKLDKSLFSIKNLKKLRKIIYRYPKSEYYTAIAIQLLIFAAKNSVFIDTYEGDTHDGPLINYTNICKYANVKIIELLDSDDIHDYQKYLILRYLFKSNTDTSIHFENFEIRKIINNEVVPLRVEIPFEKQLKSIVINFKANSDYYPLKMISTELYN